MIISYSNLGLDVSSAILSDHPDLWFLSANPFDAILTMSAKTSESALQSSLDRAAKYVIDALGCTVGNFNKRSCIKYWVHLRLFGCLTDHWITRPNMLQLLVKMSNSLERQDHS